MNISTSNRHILSCLLLLYGLLGDQSLRAQPLLDFVPVISTGLNSPLDIVNAADGTNRLFIVERGGTIKVYDAAYNLLGNFLIVPGIVPIGEQGLLSMAFHPDYETNRYFFVYYTNAAGDVEIARFQTPAGTPNTADPATKTVVLTIEKPTHLSNHNGGKLNFGPDGYLYFGTGDGGGAGDESNYAQRGDSLLGKMIRINVSTGTSAPWYTVPTDNPFVTATDTLHEIWAFGLRNPWRWSFDRTTGDMWIADVGQGNWEEVNHRVAGATGGINYGWRCYEGNNTYNTAGCLPAANYINPIYEYGHNSAGGQSITGGIVYRGTQYPTLAGYYITADYVSHNVWLIKQNGATYDVTPQTDLPGGIVGFGETESGELLTISLDSSTLYKVAVSSTLPVTLLSFTAKALPGYNELQWKTVAEIYFREYSIEYSTDGIAYTKAGSMPPVTNATNPVYTFKHPITFEGKIFYRLKMTDRDGSGTYSKVISLDTHPNKGPAIELYPTVLRYGQLQVTLNEPFTNLQVVNMNGQVLLTQNLQDRTGVIRLNTSQFSKGPYSVVVSRAGKKVSKTFIVQ